ncbi:MAG TPA: ribonuclease J [Patescibacteria group bacterium]|jgi:ribonuclease J|nr:ribonuclease J [Patescibacteria group bacterium]
MENNLSLIPIGGVGDVTKNMYLYEYKNEILIVDCGLGFADETMLGVDLLIPDVTYLKNLQGKKIVGMALTHGHEDHIGGLPYVLPDLPGQFPIYGTPLTAELANAKLKDYGLQPRVQKVNFDGGEIKIGPFTLNFIRVTHSVLDSSNIFIKTPAGNFYHGSDYKIDLTPFDGKKTDFKKIAQVSKEGVLCMLSDCLGAERKGHTPSEFKLTAAFEEELENCKGKFIVTTYSSNISRVNQVLKVAEKFGRKVCFVGRSVIKAKEIAQNLGYIRMPRGMEIATAQLKNYKDSDVVLLVAGSQGQGNSALSRIVSGEFKEIHLTSSDVVIFSADPIPGNEVSVYALVDDIARIGARVIYSELSDEFHVSGHASSDDLTLMMNLVSPKIVLPIGGTFRQMVAYRGLAEKQGFEPKNILLLEDGQEVLFNQNGARLGKKLNLENVYVDQISGEEVESFVLRDRQRLATDGVVVVLSEFATSGQIDNLDIIVKGLSQQETTDIQVSLAKEIKEKLTQRAGTRDRFLMRKAISEIAEKFIFRKLRKRPLVLPVIIEV